MTPLRREFSNSRDRNFKPPVFHHIRAAAHITLSHSLFVGENPISARDAYWLGLIDEVLGTDLNCERRVMESKENKTSPAPPSA